MSVFEYIHDLDEFEKISTILIEEGFAYVLHRAKVLPKISPIHRIKYLFETYKPFSYRIMQVFQRAGGVYTEFGSYLATRYDIVAPQLTTQLATLKVVYPTPNIARTYKSAKLYSSKNGVFSYKITKNKIASIVSKKQMKQLEHLQDWAHILDILYPNTFFFKEVAHDFLVHKYFTLNLSNQKKALHFAKTFMPTVKVLKSTPDLLITDIPKGKPITKKVTASIPKQFAKALFTPLFTKRILFDASLDCFVADKKIQLVKGMQHFIVSQKELQTFIQLLQAIQLQSATKCTHLLFGKHAHMNHVADVLAQQSSTGAVLKGLLRIAQKKQIQISRPMRLFIQIITLIEDVQLRAGIQPQAYTLIEPYVFSYEQKRMKKAIATYADAIPVSTDIPQRVDEESFVKRIEEAVKKSIYCMIICTFLIIGTLLLLFNQQIQWWIISPFLLVGLFLVAIIVYHYLYEY